MGYEEVKMGFGAEQECFFLSRKGMRRDGKGKV